MAARARQRIPELSGIEFTGHVSVANYAQELRALMRDCADETRFGAEEIYAVLSRQEGHPLLLGVDVRVRARRVARRLHRVSELNAGAAVEAVRFYAEFRRQFADAISPPPRNARQMFNFNDDGAGDAKVAAAANGRG
jgi:hypothetical protein